jgi:hypothetical protein
MPDSIFSVVDLPAPFGPMIATRSRCAISNEISPTASMVRMSRAKSPLRPGLRWT